MIRGRLSEAAAGVNGVLTGADAEFNGVSTDTRQLEARQLFVALEGPNFDGHAFVDTAAERGAAGAVVGRAVDSPLPQIRTDDTLIALVRGTARLAPGPDPALMDRLAMKDTGLSRHPLALRDSPDSVIVGS